MDEVKPNMWTAPANQTRGEKVKSWFSDNWKKLIIAAVGVGLFIFVVVWVMRTRSNNRSVMLGMQAQNQRTSRSARPRQRRVLGGQAEQRMPPVETTQQPLVNDAQAPAIMCQQGLPKPFNVFQDNLVGSNDITVGPGVASATGVGNGAGLPVDYAGACGAANPAAVWQSSQLLPANCGQSLEGTSDWQIYAPSNYQVTNFLSAGANFGQDTVMTTLKNASLDLRPEPPIPMSGCFQVPFGQSSWVDNAMMNTDWSHSLVA